MHIFVATIYDRECQQKINKTDLWHKYLIFTVKIYFDSTGKLFSRCFSYMCVTSNDREQRFALYQCVCTTTTTTATKTTKKRINGKRYFEKMTSSTLCKFFFLARWIYPYNGTNADTQAHKHTKCTLRSYSHT